MGLGIDQSLSSTGFAQWLSPGKKARFGSIKTTNAVDDIITRQREVAGELEKVIRKNEIEYAAMEDYAYGLMKKNPKTSAKLCELGGIIKSRLCGLGLVVFVVNTQWVKQWVGCGNKDDKSKIVKAVNKKWGFGFKVKENDMADALILAEIGDACWAKLNRQPYPIKLNPRQQEIVQDILDGKDTVLRV